MSVRLWMAAGLLTASLGGAAGGAANAARTIHVSATGIMFSPATITVKAGATVIWVNLDEEPHTIFSDSGAFRSSALDTKESFSYTFDKPGTYRYLCSIHAKMTGTVIVE
jgi:plastocyanin